MVAQNSEHRNGRMERPIFLLRRQRGGIVDGQIPPAFLHIEPQRHLVIVLSRDGQTAEVCIIRVSIRHGQVFAIYNFVGGRALVQ